MEEKKRIIWIDVLKGFATILVVFGHVVDGYLNADLFLNNTIILKIFFNIIYSFHMPLFFIISGYMFANAYLKNNVLNSTKYKRQLINLIILYFSFSILQWCFKFALGGLNIVNHEVTLKNLLMIAIEPMSPYWYLYDLILFYIMYRVFLKIERNNFLKLISIFALYFIFVLLNVHFDNYIITKFQNLIYYYIFFFVGTMISHKFFKKSNIFIGSIIYAFIMICYYIFNISTSIREIPIINVITALSASVAIITIFYYCFKNYNLKFLNICGKYCLEIYLIHCYFTTFNRIFLIKLGINNFYLNILTNTIVSTLAPLILVLVSYKINIHDYIFRPYKKFLEKKNC